MPNLSQNLSGFGNIVAVTVTAEDGSFTDDLVVGDDAVVGDDLDVVGDLTAGTIASDANVTATGVVLTGAGSAANAAHSFSGDPNTGWINPGADQLQAVCGGVAQATIANGSVTINPALVIAGAEYSTGYLTPTALAGNTDNYAPGLSNAISTLLISASTPVNLTGISAISNYKLRISNTSANTITLVHDATSTATNRFYCPGAANFALTQYKTVTVLYVASLSRWLVQG